MMSTVKKGVQMETDFPRGGVKQDRKKRRIPKPEKDLFKTDEESLKKPKVSQEVKKTQTRQNKQRKKKNLLPNKSSENAENLKFKQVEKGMHVLGCVAKVDEFSLTFDLPGGLQGEVSITNISDAYTEQLKRLTGDDSDDEDDDEETAQLSDMFHPGMILPCRVIAVKIRSGSKKKIFLSINPQFVNKDVTTSHLTEGLTMIGSVTACEDHGYVIDIGVQGISAFLSRKHAEKYIQHINNNNPLQIGQVVWCYVISVSSRVVKVGINPHQVEKAQLPRDKKWEKNGVVSGMKVSGTVKEVLNDGLLVDFSGQVGYVHRTHTTQYKHKKLFSKGAEVNGTVLYTLSDNKTIYLSLLPHLAGTTCSLLYEKYSMLADKKTLYDVHVLDVLKKAVYFNMDGGIRALATLANLSAVTDFKVPLHKTFSFGGKQRCTVFGFNMIENVLLVRLQREIPEQESLSTKSSSAVDKSPPVKRKANDTTESKTPKIESELKQPKSKKKKLDTCEKISKTEEQRGVTLTDTPKDETKRRKSKHIVDVESESSETDVVKRPKKKKMKKEEVISEEEENEESIDEETSTKQEAKNESKKQKKGNKDKTESKSKEKKDKKVRPLEETDSGVEMNKMSDTDDDEDMKVSRVGANPPRLPLSAGFSWSEDFSTAPSTRNNDSSDDEAEDVKQTKKTGQELRKERIEEEKKIFAYERQQLEGEQVPVTSEDFDRLTLQSPDSSLVWTRYMAFHLETVEIDKARAVAERALKTISFREEQEKLNIWVAYLNLENMYGGDEQLRAVFDRAVQQNEPIKVYKQMVQIYVSSGKMEDGEKMYNTMTKKFSQDKSVWTGFGLFFFKNNRLEPARKVLQRCLKCLEKREHVDMISKFAQLEYKYGESQRGCTMFENILTNYPKRTDIWSVYLDMVIKTGNFDEVRSLFERVIHMKMSTKKMQFFFKKYMDFEKKHGDSKSVEKVKQKAVDYVESQGFSESS